MQIYPVLFQSKSGRSNSQIARKFQRTHNCLLSVKKSPSGLMPVVKFQDTHLYLNKSAEVRTTRFSCAQNGVADPSEDKLNKRKRIYNCTSRSCVSFS